MKIGVIFGAITCVYVFGVGSVFAATHPRPPRMDLEMTGREYRALMSKRHQLALEVTDPNLQAILDFGKRNLDWIDFINQHRDADHQLSFSSKDSEVGYPIDQPKYSNPTIIGQNFTSLKAALPVEMANVLLQGAELTPDVPVAEADYLKWGLQCDRVYQAASRWLLELPYLNEMANLRTSDVRGYYYLSQEQGIEAKLASWATLSSDDQAKYRGYLQGLCLNDDTNGGRDAVCTGELGAAIQSQTVAAFFAKYLPAGKALWDSYFFIPKTRDDTIWTEQDPNTLWIPFAPPGVQKVQDYLVDNIEDEWKQGDWHLRLKFEQGAETHVIFEPGATPHVNDIAGSEITMDANAPLSEYDVRWTIRHEFGHVLGFPDCYTEFYDAKQAVMVSYQLDITDLMCSRRGQFKQRHFDDLKKNYFK